MKDQRPDPKPRKHAHLWQAYLTWDELMQMRKKHLLRASSIERGVSHMDGEYEDLWLATIDPLVNQAQKEMIAYGKACGSVWDWLTGIKGIGDHTAAKIIAQIDDPGKFATISKLWRFSGYAVIDGKIDRPTKGEKLVYNRRLKSELHLMAENFVRHQTPLYVDVYYEEKDYQRGKYPEPICKTCGAVAKQKSKSWNCTECSASGFGIAYTPGHLQSRAYRKVIKLFLSHLWIIWREAEELPTTLPYAHAILGHSNYIEPERFMEDVTCATL